MSSLRGSVLPQLLLCYLVPFSSQAQRIFTEAEEQQLTQLLGFAETDLHTVLDACAYIYEQAAYRSASGPALQAQLAASGLEDEQAAVIAAVWAERAAPYIAQLRDRSLGMPHVLTDVDWRLHLVMGQNRMAKTQELKSIFSLQLGNKAGASGDTVTVEFSEKALFSLYSQLESVQEQLDALT